jgi:hypothetical protein
MQSTMKRLWILALLLTPAGIMRAQSAADVRAFGTFAAFSSTTATTTSGRPTISLASAQNFKNGEYVTVFNAGPSCSLSTPSAPTVTPVVNSGGIETVAANSGSSSFAYEIVAADKFGCYTAASSSGSTSTGNPLGRQTNSTITSITTANNTVTVRTSTAHGLAAGELAYIQYFSTSGLNSFEGFWIVSSVPDSRHFTFLWSNDTRLNGNTGATVSTSGAVIGFNANKLSWPAVAGAWKYYVYGRTGATFTLLGQTLFPYYVDYGSPMNDNQTFPAFIPTSPPRKGANDHLTGKILSGGGTTTLTLASNAGASLSDVAIKSDDGPALKAAGLVTNGGAVYIPPAGITINSYTQLKLYQVSLQMAGSIRLNDTLEAQGSLQAIGTNNPPPSAFTWSGYSAFNGAAYPLLNTIGGANHFYNIGFICPSLNGCLNYAAVVDDSNINDTFDYVYWATGAGQTNDCIGQHAIFATGGFSFRFNKNTFATSPCGANSEASVGLSPIPSFVFMPRIDDNTPTGNWVVEHSWFLNRGSFDQDSGTSTLGVNYGGMSDLQTQNSLLPIVQFTGFGLGAGDFFLHGITPADYPSAMIANYTQKAVVGINVSEITAIQGGHNFFTGNPFVGVAGLNIETNSGISRDITIGGFATSIVDGNLNPQPSGGSNIGVQIANVITDIGNPYSLFINGATPAAPTCSVSSGGFIPVGTYSFSIAPVWWNNSVGVFSPFSGNCKTTTGKQTLTVNWTAVSGVKGYYLAVGGANGVTPSGPFAPPGGCAAPGAYQASSATSVVFSGPGTGSCGGSIPIIPGGGPTIMNASGFFAPALHLNPTLFVNLGPPINYVIKMCADCVVANPCAGGGTGALAKGLNNQWVCN